MFTGLVEGLERVLGRADTTDTGHRLRIAVTAASGDLAVGDSVAVDGCCLTVATCTPEWWEADVSTETLSRTTVGGLEPGAMVNVERAVRPTDRLGGHIVQGHVDAVGTVLAPAPDLVVSLPDGLTRYVVEKGSIAVDGVSLTVVEVHDDRFRVAVVAHTAAVTTLGTRVPGDRVNLEVDVTAKYVEKLLAWQGAAR